jgi:hypothetical protein
MTIMVRSAVTVKRSQLSAMQRIVREQHGLGYDGVMIYYTLGREPFRAAVRTAAYLGMPLSGHLAAARRRSGWLLIVKLRPIQ